VWRGHVGIVVNPQEHSFFSTTSSRTHIQGYRSAYWRTRGYPRFFRFLTKNPLKNGGAGETSNRPPAWQTTTLRPSAFQPPPKLQAKTRHEISLRSLRTFVLPMITPLLRSPPCVLHIL
jgi:hypothetical protein